MNLNKVIPLLFILFLASVESRQLIFVQQLFRHGARYPQSNDNYSQFVKIQGFAPGELTLQGKHMQYLLGKIMYKTYWKQLFAGTKYEHQYSPSQIYVMSTNVNRTIESAQAQLQGLLQKLPPYELPVNILNRSLPPHINSNYYNIKQINSTHFHAFGQKNANFYPIPIHIEKQFSVSSTKKYSYNVNVQDQGDFLSKTKASNCPNQKIWLSQNFHSTEAQRIINSNQITQFLTSLGQAVGTNITFQKAPMYVDAFICKLFTSQKLLQLYNNPEALRVAYFIMLVSSILEVGYTEDQIKTGMTRFIQQTITNIRQAMAGRGPKIVLYSAHLTTILAFGAAFNFFSLQCSMDNFYRNISNKDLCISDYPSFASNFIIQLWKEEDLSYNINIAYNGEKRKIPICGYKTACSMFQLQNWARSFYIQDLNSVCGITHQSLVIYYIIIAILSLIVLMCMAYLMSSNCKKLPKQRARNIQQIDKSFQYLDEE